MRKKAGYAEADPTFDVAGIDQCAQVGHSGEPGISARRSILKICIPKGLPISPRMTSPMRKSLDYTIKLLGIAKLVEGDVEARVHPTMLGPSRQWRKSKECITPFN